MAEKSHITKRSSARFLAVLFIMTVASLFIMSFTTAALAQGNMQGDRGSLKGEIVAIDNVHNVKTLTLRSEQWQFPNDTLNIFVHKDTKFNLCSESKPLKDMGVDRNATVTYHEVGGVAVADSISEHC
jgi:hypothetical protein